MSISQLTNAIWERFPDRPPYGGAWPDIVPHLSVGRFADEAAMDQVAAELATALEQAPIRARAGTVILIEDTAGRWIARRSFKLGG